MMQKTLMKRDVVHLQRQLNTPRAFGHAGRGKRRKLNNLIFPRI